MNWAAWSPAIIAAVSAIVSIGALYSRVGDHQKRLDEHDVKLESLAISAARAEGFAQGFKANHN